MESRESQCKQCRLRNFRFRMRRWQNFKGQWTLVKERDLLTEHVKGSITILTRCIRLSPFHLVGRSLLLKQLASWTKQQCTVLPVAKPQVPVQQSRSVWKWSSFVNSLRQCYKSSPSTTRQQCQSQSLVKNPRQKPKVWSCGRMGQAVISWVPGLH